MTALDLNDVLRTEIEIQKGSLEDEHQVEVSVKLHSSPAAFFGRYRDISQMFALLLDAALQAMDGRHKKQLSITTTMTENAIGFDLTFTRKPPPIHDGSNAYAPLPLNVSGWPKDLDDGSGLALSQIIVKQYGGRIAVLNSEESHSTISVRWPLPKNEARLDRAS